MSRTYIEATYIEPNVCFECGAPATERHHVVPHSLGGTKTVPLCGICHAKIHDVDGKRRTRIAELTKAALDAKKARGETWVRNLDTSVAVAASAKARTAARENWMKESEVGKYIQAKWMEGLTFTDILHDLERLYEISPDVYCSRTGGRVSKGTLSKMLPFYSEWKKDYIPQTTRKTTKEEWLKESEVGKYVLARWMEDLSVAEILYNLEKLYAIKPNVYCSRTGKQISQGQLYDMISFFKKWKKDHIPQNPKIRFLLDWAKRANQPPFDLNLACKIGEKMFRNEEEGYMLFPMGKFIKTKELKDWEEFFYLLCTYYIIKQKYDADGKVYYVFTSDTMIIRLINTEKEKIKINKNVLKNIGMGL